jgi:ABC-type phosphate transport system substrate-binding protein
MIKTPLINAMLAALLLGTCVSAAAEVVVVVSAKSSATALTQEQAADIVPVDQAEGAGPRDEFYQKSAGKNAAQLKAYWSQRIFSGKGQPPKAAGDNGAVKAMLAANPTMVGYIDKSAVDASVKPLLTVK